MPGRTRARRGRGGRPPCGRAMSPHRHRPGTSVRSCPTRARRPLPGSEPRPPPPDRFSVSGRRERHPSPRRTGWRSRERRAREATRRRRVRRQPRRPTTPLRFEAPPPRRSAARARARLRRGRRRVRLRPAAFGRPTRPGPTPGLRPAATEPLQQGPGRAPASGRLPRPPRPLQPRLPSRRRFPPWKERRRRPIRPAAASRRRWTAPGRRTRSRHPRSPGRRPGARRSARAASDRRASRCRRAVPRAQIC